MQLNGKNHFSKITRIESDQTSLLVWMCLFVSGCPTILYFFHKYVSEDWKANNIHEWVALSAPWMGGANLVESYLGGWTLGFPSWLIPHDYVRRVQVNASSNLSAKRVETMQFVTWVGD